MCPNKETSYEMIHRYGVVTVSTSPKSQLICKIFPSRRSSLQTNSEVQLRVQSSFVLWYHEQTIQRSIIASSYPLLSFCSPDGGGGGLLSLIKKSLFCTARLDITSSSSSRRPRHRFCGGTSLPTSVLSLDRGP